MSPSKWRKKQRRHQKRLDYLLRDKNNVSTYGKDEEIVWKEILIGIGLGLVFIFLLISFIFIAVHIGKMIMEALTC